MIRKHIATIQQGMPQSVRLFGWSVTDGVSYQGKVRRSIHMQQKIKKNI